MRARQPTMVFGFTVLVGLLRAFAYAGMPIGEELSVPAFLHYVGLHILAFAFAAFLVAYLSRATTTRASFVALYAQAILFLAAFVDVGLGLALSDYGRTYTGVFGGSPGSTVAVLAYGAVIAWGVHDATLGPRSSRILGAALAGIGGVLGVSFLAISWPRAALFGVPGLSIHLSLAVYFSVLAAIFLCLAIQRANPAAFREIRNHTGPEKAIGFSLLPVLGVFVAARLLVPQVPNDSWQRFPFEFPYVLAGMMCAAALWVQWSLVRAHGWGPMRLEAVAASMVVALAFALPLGPFPFVAAAIAGSAAWLGRVPRGGIVVGIVAGFAVLVGNLTVVAIDFAEPSIGPATFLVPLNQNPSLSLGGVVVVAAVGVLVALVAYLTSRISASGKDPSGS